VTDRRFWGSLALACLLLPVFVAAQMERPQPTSAGRPPAVALDGRELPVPVTINPAGPLFGLQALVDSLGGELAPDPAGESATLKLAGKDVVIGLGSAIITVGEDIVSLSQPPTRGDGGFQVPLDFLRKTYGDLQGYSFDWRPEESRLAISRRAARELPVMLDVVHLQGMSTVVLQFPDTPHYRLNRQPGVVEVQMLGDRLSPPAPRKVQDPLVQEVAIAPQQVRIQVVPGAEVESYVLEKPFRLVFDVHQPAAVVTPATPAPAAAEAGTGIRTIVIDPGHGGGETGAIGPSGVAEKDLTLLLARELESHLAQRLPVRVVLTRSEDSTLPLDTRAAIANQNKADLFISIHLNSSLGAGARGAETYFLSSQATDPRAASSAAAENLGAAGGPQEQGKSEESQELQLILWDLAQAHHLAESQRFAGLVQGELNEELQLKDRGVKQAPFRVLVGAAMPAVLVELGFLSNPEEEKRLQDPAYRAQLAEALTRAVARYKAAVEGKEPPPAAGATPATPAPAPAPAPAPKPQRPGTP
jgi:N-acetylmuramoyl-L-alanine amidase